MYLKISVAGEIGWKHGRRTTTERGRDDGAAELTLLNRRRGVPRSARERVRRRLPTTTRTHAQTLFVDGGRGRAVAPAASQPRRRRRRWRRRRLRGPPHLFTAPRLVSSPPSELHGKKRSSGRGDRGSSARAPVSAAATRAPRARSSTYFGRRRRRVRVYNTYYYDSQAAQHPDRVRGRGSGALKRLSHQNSNPSREPPLLGLARLYIICNIPSLSSLLLLRLFSIASRVWNSQDDTSSAGLLVLKTRVPSKNDNRHKCLWKMPSIQNEIILVRMKINQCATNSCIICILLNHHSIHFDNKMSWCIYS